jgi:hypothetical protein
MSTSSEKQESSDSISSSDITLNSSENILAYKLDMTNMNDYGKISVISFNDDITNNKVHLKYHSVNKKTHASKCKDIFDIDCLNRTLTEYNEYVISGFFGGRIGLLFTNYGSLIISCRYELCRKCKEKWKHTMYISGTLCDCYKRKYDCRIMCLQRGNMKLPNEHIDYIKMIVAERSKEYSNVSIYHRAKKLILKDMSWCDNLYKIMLNMSKKYIASQFSELQLLQLRDENDLGKKRICELTSQNQEYTNRIAKL